MACAACTVITGDLGRIIAIEIDGGSARSVEENDTIVLSARAVDAAGDTVPNVTVVWELLTANSGFEIDSLTGMIHALFPGNGRVRGRVEELRSDTISIVVTAAPDSIAANSDTRITMSTEAAVSPRIETVLLDITTEPGTARPLGDKMVTFRLIDPAPGASDSQGFFLTEGDTLPGLDLHTIAVPTDGAGRASVLARRIPGSLWPDSAVVDAVSVTAIRDTVAGSPVRFVIVFESVP